jgi:hypothetical protein
MPDVKIEDIEEAVDEMITIRPLNTFLFTMSSDKGSTSYVIETDADEANFKEILRNYMCAVGTCSENEEHPKISDLFKEEGNYCSINKSVNK